VRLVITTDAVGGVWTYTRELAAELAQRGHEILLVCFGPSPSYEQCASLKSIRRLDERVYPLKLEWMADCESDIAAARVQLAQLIDEHKPDLLHANQFCFGALESSVPRIVVVHSDVVSWWHTVHGTDPSPADFPHISFYRELVLSAVSQANATVAISRTVSNDLSAHYAHPEHCDVIYNGVDPSHFISDRPKKNHVLCVGRFWDKAKNLAILNTIASSRAFRIAGDKRGLGILTPTQLREEYADAEVYLHPALYEPFGLAPLEAALSGCALLLSDIPSLREIWGEHAQYFDPRDSHDLSCKLAAIAGTRNAREHAIANYTAEHMADQYCALYRKLLGNRAVAA